MNLEILETVFFRINEFLTSHPEEEITIVWHGGEPLLLTPEFYRVAAEYQDKHCHSTKNRLSNCMQSNLTLFSDEYVDNFKKLGLDQIGTSYDPEPGIRGLGNTVDSNHYNSLFMKGHSLAKKHGFGGGIIYVVTKKSLKSPLDVFYFFTNFDLSSGFNMNPVLIYDFKRKDLAITPQEYIKFLGEIFPIWWNHRDRFGHVEPFTSLVKNIVEKRISLGCVDSGNCAQTHINIAPNGETSHCGRSDDWGLLKYGNIQNKTLKVLFSDFQRKELSNRSKILQQEDCYGCRLWDLCHGGCPLDAYTNEKTFMKKSEWCFVKKRFIEDYFEPITGYKWEPVQRVES